MAVPRGCYERGGLDQATLRAEVEALRAEVMLLREKIARLEQANGEITDEQIDAALQKLRKYKESSEFKDTLVWSTLLDIFGIVGCPECEGLGQVIKPIGKYGDLGYDCPICHTHGWIREQPAHPEQANGTQEVSDE
jgi:hypothetical protein